jgi:hypothetical protein
MPNKYEYTWYKDRDGDYYLPKEIARQIVDENNPDTFIPLLKMGDYPYIKFCWDNLKEHLPNRNTFGRYISLMNLCHWKNYRFRDSIYSDEKVWNEPRRPLREDKLTNDKFNGANCIHVVYRLPFTLKKGDILYSDIPQKHPLTMEYSEPLKKEIHTLWENKKLKFEIIANSGILVITEDFEFTDEIERLLHAG